MPIGNPDDITLRALKILEAVAIVAVEDVRVSRPLLARYGISAELTSVRSRKDSDSTQSIVASLVAGNDVALICDAGTPSIADPGARLVALAIEEKCRVSAVPGAVAAIAALTISGIDCSRFNFRGFPPRSKTDRAEFFDGLHSLDGTIVLYESRRYLTSTLSGLISALNPRCRCSLSRDLTKISEVTLRGTLEDQLRIISSLPPHGEFVLVIEWPFPSEDSKKNEQT